MDLKHMLLAILVVVVVIGASFFLINYDDSVKYESLEVSNSCSIDIPISDESNSSVISEGINFINDTQHDLIVYYFNSENGSAVAAAELAFLRDDFKANATEQTVANQTVWYNEENGTYMAFLGSPETHDNVMIVCKDQEILEHMIASLKIYTLGDNATGETNGVVVDSNSTTDAASTSSNTSSVSSTASNSSSSSDGYYWSGQDQDYIKEYTDSNGIQHIDRKNGVNEAYDPSTQKHYTNGVEDTDAYNQDFN